MNFSLEINQAIEWTVRLVSVCVLIDTLENFYNYREFKNEGLFNWEWVRRHPGFRERRRIIRKLADLFFGFGAWFSLLAIRGATALILLFLPHQRWISAIGLFIMFFVGSLANYRRMPYRAQTVNRFSTLIIGALFLQTLVPTEIVKLACLWFIALQSCLSYATAGIIKLINKDWQRGVGLFKVLNTPNLLTSASYAGFFQRHSGLSKIFNYLTIALESLFPLVLFVGKPYFFVFLIWGIAFHITNAILLRISNFFWAWIATYPAIIYIALL